MQDIWILNEAGIVLFSRAFNEKIKDQLFGSLVSALDTFANEISDGGISNFELSNKRFTLMRSMNVLFVVNSTKKVKDKNLKTKIQDLVKRFFNRYPIKLIESWDGDLNTFSDFKTEIDDMLEDPVKKFWDGF